MDDKPYRWLTSTDLIMQIRVYLFFWLSTTVACAQVSSDCGCDQVITSSGTYKYDGRPMPNQTVCIRAGNYTHLQFFNYVGTTQKPVRFINCGGKVVLSTGKSPSGLAFYDSKFFTVSGSGSDYGIRIDQTAPGGQGVSVSGKSSDCEIEYVEVAGADFAGIMVKTDPTCDPTTWQGNLVMNNINIHHNYIHDVGGEGLYIGNSFFGTGMTRTCEGKAKTVFPHTIYGLEIHHNLIERTGAEGIQYGCAPDAVVHHNVVMTTGVAPFATYQNNGIQIGGGAGGRLYSNIVSGVPGTGVIIIGHLGNTTVYDNFLLKCGELGIFCDDRVGSQAGALVSILNNTIIDCGREGIKLYNEINRNTIANNVIAKVAPSQTGRIDYVLFGQGTKANVSNNRFSASLDSLGFVDGNSTEKGFMLSKDSPLIDAGMDVSAFDVFFDLNGNVRRMGRAVDIGAHEFMPENTLLIFPNPPTDLLTIQAGAVIHRITIYNELGVELATNVPLNASDVGSVSVKSLNAGLYILNVETKAGKQAGKFVKR